MSKKKKTSYTKQLITTKMENDSGFDMSKILDQVLEEPIETKTGIQNNNNVLEIENKHLTELT